MSQAADKLIQAFREEIQRNDDYRFGLYLYQASSPRLVRWMQKGSYRRTVARITGALAVAEALVGVVEAEDAPAAGLALFEWPPWTPAMEQRIQMMLKVYSSVFPSRAKAMLTKQEATRLREAVLKRL